MSLLGFLDFMCETYGNTRFEMIISLISWIFGVLFTEAMIYIILDNVISAIQKLKDHNEKIIDDDSFFIEGIEDLKDIDIFKPIN